MKLKVCNAPSCRNLIPTTETYCKEHQHLKHKPFENAKRSNTRLYNTKRWRDLKKEVINETPFCSYCGISKEETTLQVHHSKPPRGNEELFYDKKNLEVVCPECHRVLTSVEIRQRKNNQ